MAQTHAGPAAHRGTAPSWHGALAPFAPRVGESLHDAVLVDMQNALRSAGEFPSPARYASAVDPARHALIAQEIVVQAFELAPRAVSELAEAWKRSHPGWTVAIDRARAAISLLEAIDDVEEGADLAAAPRVGSPMTDGQGRYELVERIGAGSSGTVFRAIDHVLSQCGAPVHVAIKLVACASEEADLRLREAGAARAISHGAIARVLDAGVVADEAALRRAGARSAIFIASEFIAGVPLYIWKAMHPERSGADCARIAIAVAEALACCHAQGIAHGDVSPANVVVAADGAVRVVDFGLASWHAAHDGSSSARDQAKRDQRRVAELMQWLVRGLPPSRGMRRAIDDVERHCDGRGARRSMGPRTAAALAAACVGVAAAAVAYAMNASRPTDPVAALFGEALASRPDLADLTRDLLDDGRPTLWTAEVFAAKVRALREEATMARRRGTPARELELIAALAAMATPEWHLGRPFAALSVDGDFGDGLASGDEQALRGELAWAIAWSCDFVDTAQPAEGVARIEALARAIAAPGLPALLRDRVQSVPEGVRSRGFKSEGIRSEPSSKRASAK